MKLKLLLAISILVFLEDLIIIFSAQTIPRISTPLEWVLFSPMLAFQIYILGNLYFGMKELLE